MQVESMQQCHIEGVLELERRTGLTSWQNSDYLNLLLNPEIWTGLVVLDELETGREIVVGFCLGMWIPPEAELTKLAVNPKWRSRGIASLLVDQILQEARKRDCSVCYLEVRASNQPAIDLYMKLGFVFLQSRKNYYANPQEDAWIMACDLTSKP